MLRSPCSKYPKRRSASFVAILIVLGELGHSRIALSADGRRAMVVLQPPAESLIPVLSRAEFAFGYGLGSHDR